MVSVDTEKKDYVSPVKEDFLEVASQWSVEGYEGGGRQGNVKNSHMFASSSMSVLGKEAFSYLRAWRRRKDRTTHTTRPS